ncbi:MAG: 50S ribosomal protein L6, partial [Bacillota bacterium]
MSRVGIQPIGIPEKVQVSVEKDVVKVSGPRGELQQRVPREITVSTGDGHIVVARGSDDRRSRSLHGLMRSLIANMVTGVSEGFSKSLVIEGTGYRASVSGNKLVLSVGYSHPVEIIAPDAIEIEVPNQKRVIVRGPDKQMVGQVAAEIRDVRRP